VVNAVIKKIFSLMKNWRKKGNFDSNYFYFDREIEPNMVRSTIECYCQPPATKFGSNCKQAILFYKTSQYFQIKKNNIGYLLCIFTIFKLLSTTEQMPALFLR
jgi:hypothetical protein